MPKELNTVCHVRREKTDQSYDVDQSVFLDCAWRHTFLYHACLYPSVMNIYRSMKIADTMTVRGFISACLFVRSFTKQ